MSYSGVLRWQGRRIRLGCGVEGAQLLAAVRDELGECDGLVVEVECGHARGAGGDDLRPELAQAVDRGVRVAGALDEGLLGPVGDTAVGPREDGAAGVLVGLFDDLSGQCGDMAIAEAYGGDRAEGAQRVEVVLDVGSLLGPDADPAGVLAAAGVGFDDGVGPGLEGVTMTCPG
ncbi:hypothetical protein ACFYXC_38500 [Streptomyces sp. NPDC002701]|uniref:hypothetical protein n=1 Tax=Streptomyces sp. NPDC002701 TaxID=3364661 RepID=UPI0036C7246B